MKRSKSVWVLSAALAMGSFACGDDGDDKNDTGGGDTGGQSGGGGSDGNGTDEGKDLKFLFVPKDTTNPVFRPAIDGATLRGRELADLGNDRVTVEVVAPEKTDADTQGTMLAEALAKGGVSGIAIACSTTTSETLNAALTDAKEAGIPIVAWDSDCAVRDAYYSFDNAGAGRLAAQLLSKELNGKGNVAVLTGAVDEANLIARLAGFTEELEQNHPDVKLVSTVSCHPLSEDHLCPPKIDAAMQENEVDGWFFAAVWMRIMARGDTRADLPEKIPAAELWQAAAKSGDVKTVALDSMKEALPFVDDGRIQVLIGQKYWGWGYDTIGLLYDTLMKEKSLSGFVDSGTDLICEANVGEYEAAWASNDFSVELPSCE
jgi:ribose transport system substrate-binding protein